MLSRPAFLKMALSPAESSCRSLQTLPLEVLLEISKYIPDFASLNGFFTLLTAHYQGVSFIQTFQSNLFANVIRFNRENQITRIATAVMSLRNDTTIHRPFPKDGLVELNFVWMYLLSPEIECARLPHYLPWFSDPIATTRDICQISEGIEKLVQVFLNACIIKPSGQEDGLPVSSSELYRTCRAFWHFQFFYDMCHADEAVPYGFDSELGSPLLKRFPCYRTRRIQMLSFLDTDRLEPTNPILPDFLTFFLRNTRDQEVEEFGTVHYFLALLISKLQCGGHRNSSRLKSQPGLLQRLMNDFGNQRDDPIESMAKTEFRYGEARFALQRSHGCPPQFEAPNKAFSSIVSIISDQNWGCRMWDRVRLAKRSLNSHAALCSVDSKSNQILQECKQAQSMYLDDWVSKIHHDDVELEERIP